MEDSQEKDYSFLGNDTFPNLYDALVYERKFKSEYLERQIYERLLKSEPSIVKFIENQSEHLSKLTLYHLKNVLQGDLDVLLNRAEFIIFMQSRVPLGPESKPLKDLFKDPSLDEICNHLDTPLAGLGNYEQVARHYGYDVFAVEARFKPAGGPSKALILSIIGRDPDVTVESFAKVAEKQAKRKDVAKLLRDFDHK